MGVRDSVGVVRDGISLVLLPLNSSPSLFFVDLDWQDLDCHWLDLVEISLTTAGGALLLGCKLGQ